MFTDFHSGRLWLMLFPLAFFLNITLRFDLVEKKKVVVVEPIKNNRTTARHTKTYPTILSHRGNSPID